MSEGKLIKKFEVFELRCEDLGEIHTICVRANRDIRVGELEKMMSNAYNLHKLCEDDFCEGSAHNFDADYNFCPFCNKPLVLQQDKLTLSEFVESRSDILIEVHLISVSSSNLRYYAI